MTNLTEYPSAHELHTHLYVYPLRGWQEGEFLKLTPERIEAIESIVIEKRATGIDEEYFIEIIIDGVHYWDRLGDRDQINQPKDWKPIIDQFPIRTQIDFNSRNNIWAACRSWQRD